ncbi:hypothetical protein [Piscinibacter sp.]|uniref:hypothetical protein n=1 Tax=Piscinibacter sp. TaxID=1903157 RepID=UPI0039E6EE2A
MVDLTSRVAQTVRQHFVSLSCVQQPPDAEPKPLVFSGFVVEVAGEWFYVTAGHILRLIRAALASGSTFDIWRLGDHTVEDKFKGMAVPYDFRPEHWCVIENEELGLDYAATHVASLYRLQLEAGGTTPLARAAWGTPDMDHEHWVLVGIPSESVAYDGETIITARVVVAPLRAAEVPPQAGQRAENQFYARLADGSEQVVNNIDGMSGGPIFMLKRDDNKWKYGVIGVQSGWYRADRLIAACPSTSFAFALEEAIHALQAQASQPEGAANAP